MQFATPPLPHIESTANCFRHTHTHTHGTCATESRISVCPVVWQTILAVEKAAQAEVEKTPMLGDVLAVLQIMRRGGAFLFSVAAQIPPTANQQQQLQLREEAFPAGGDACEHKPGLSPVAAGTALGCTVWQRGMSADEIGDIDAPARTDLAALADACKAYDEAKRAAFVACPVQVEMHSLMLVTAGAVAELEGEKARFAEQRSAMIANSVVGQVMQQQQRQQQAQQQARSPGAVPPAPAPQPPADAPKPAPRPSPSTAADT